jgi:hypothetical protein
MKLDHVVPWGRTRREYEHFFGITKFDCAKRILGCSDGPASFNAEMTAEGHSVISVDPIYEFSGEQIRVRFDACHEDLIHQVKSAPERWSWSYHKNPDELEGNRTRALELFLLDYERGKRESRYRTGALPALAFRSGEFDLALCSHFLFLYSNLFDAAFHVASVRELCRVATEVRIFPILTLAQDVSPHLEAVRSTLRTEGIDSSIETVNYELQRGGNQMLRLFKIKASS